MNNNIEKNIFDEINKYEIPPMSDKLKYHKITVKEKKYFNFMKFLTYSLVPVMTLILCIFLILPKNKNIVSYSYVTIETNPGIELVVDENNVVISINGLNDDVKLLLDGEEIVGLKIDVATEKVIKLTNELGFTFEGKASSDSQEIKISVSSNISNVQKELENQLKTKVEEQINTLNLDLKLKVEESKTRQYFEEIVSSYDPTLTKEEIEKLKYEELMIKVNEATTEKAKFISVKLEEYYQELKEYEFKFYYKEQISKSIDKGYQELLEGYNKILKEFKEKITELKQLEVDTFTNKESQYVKALDEFRAKKEELMGKKVQLSVKKEAGELTFALELEIKGLEAALTFAETALNTVDQALKTTFNTIITALETIYQQLEEFEEKLPKTINIEEKLTEAEKYINENKDQLFEKFEQSFEDIKYEDIVLQVQTRKENLKQMVENNKKAE
jgi:hypothetical protein